MKRRAIILAIVFLCSASVTVAKEKGFGTYAIDVQSRQAPCRSYGLGDDINLVAGLRLGFEFYDFDRNPKDSPENLLESSDSKITYGPTFLLTYKQKFYSGLSYLAGNGNEWNHNFHLSLGYNIHPLISTFIDYQYVLLNPELGSTSGIGLTLQKGGERWAYRGPMLGLDVNYPLGDSGITAFGSIGYAFLRFEIEADYRFSLTDRSGNRLISTETSQTESGSAHGPALDIGLSYMWRTLPKLSVNSCFKYQSYTIEADWNMIDYGVIFGANYLF